MLPDMKQVIHFMMKRSMGIVLIWLVAVWLAAAETKPPAGTPVEVTLTTGRVLHGVVQASDDHGIDLELPTAGNIRLPNGLIKSIQRLEALPTLTPSPSPTPAPPGTPTLTPTAEPTRPIPTVNSIADLRRAFRQGHTQAIYNGQLVKLMPDGLFYANLDLFDKELFALHEHLVANAPIIAPTSATIPTAANWKELRVLWEKKEPVVVFKDAVAYRMPDGNYYWCEEDYELVQLEKRLKWASEFKSRKESEIEKEAEASPRQEELEEKLKNGLLSAPIPHSATSTPNPPGESPAPPR